MLKCQINFKHLLKRHKVETGWSECLMWGQNMLSGNTKGLLAQNLLLVVCCGNEPDPKAEQLPLQGAGQYKEQQAPLTSTCLWKYERQVLNKNTPIFLFLPLVSGVGLHVIKKWQHWSLLAWSSPLRILSCSGPDKCLLVYVCTHGSETRHRRAMLVAMHLPSSFSMRKMSEDPPWYFVVTWDYCI